MDHPNLDYISQSHPEIFATKSILFGNYIFYFIVVVVVGFFVQGEAGVINVLYSDNIIPCNTGKQALVNFYLHWYNANCLSKG